MNVSSRRCAAFCRPLACLLLAVLVLIVSGCSSRDPRYGLRPKAVIVLALDYSVPGTASRANQITEFNAITTAATDAHYDLDIWKYAATPTHLWGPSELSSDDVPDTLVTHDLKAIPIQKKRIARPDLVLTAVAQNPRFVPMKEGRIVFLTDGALDGQKGVQQLTQAAQRFAARPRWRIEVLGIAPQNIPLWQKALTPVFSGRCTFSSTSRSIAVLNQIHDD